METLGKLFDSTARVKVMKLFLSNEDKTFDNEDLVKRTKTALPTLRKELSLLEKAGFLKKRVFYKEIEVKIPKTKKKPAVVKIVKKKANGWGINEKFQYLAPLHSLLVDMTSFTSSSILKNLSGAGKLKLVLVSGAFIQNSESRVDILVVGDNIQTSRVDRAVGILESEIGKELRYVVLRTDDFNYRLNIYDKLVRDILDTPHQKIVNRLGI
ncbi:TPA: hypothetical protein DCZ46_01885 [Candidatus Campbellbacteria bacterium]|uniref:HTH arsR-type domain-containing protein n=2 Tax=Candidatus Campbelliibacteriota TaxID=1752727 RepID=A0A1F5EPW7_9BACT|nr:MAG: seg [Candidatus Campbellbacteria bacterium GW2011_OD1_34_28]KKP75169.1 MAG: hypothetical protein UR74_C0001G0025 [Candidatus Campbellbacteria bacterium GW2011_GWD2_35_24]KKP76270.1 MAG: hypothetical protein UR75_C0001G0304 [Candidatus Campbellbacteria bacterium GW2011_GWC2_35_28]KKP77459.1 MAG: hypothetical protein UR76_C0001G0304 [Candidatus Campbellbacteria bacterium GW2011_GWC1_35_31]KKP79388.1 MAG: hypothetical protein UR79_C0001G0304 [Candidatus Campbellbacteria bacterium GW2011_GW